MEIEPTPNLSVRRLVLDHVPIVLALCSAAVVVVRALAISRFDAVTTLAVLSSADLAGLITGSVVLLLPVLAPLLVGFIPSLADKVPASDNQFVRGSAIGLLGTAVLLVVSFATLVSGVLFVVPLLALMRRRRRRLLAEGRPVALPIQPSTLIAFVVTINFFFVVSFASPWLPPERIEVGGRTLVGYVLGSDSGWTSVLAEPQRRVERFRDGDITAREICTFEGRTGDLSATLLELASKYVARRPQTNPDCPTP